MRLRVLCTLIFSGVLAACVSTPVSTPLSKFNLSQVIVRYTVTADYQVADFEREYKDQRTDLATISKITLASTPESQAYVRGRIKDHLAPHLERVFRPRMTGSRAVTIEVRVLKVFVPGKLRGELVGEGFYMDAVFAVIDDVTGIELMAYGPIHAETDEAITLIGGEQIPNLGSSERMNEVAYYFSKKALAAIENEYRGFGPDGRF
ncbi:MAG: hypothetical protein HWE23_05815 [Rhodobacteraceae bacterium]|nr:hypothetical protein [Paracoccaceae bacterium]